MWGIADSTVHAPGTVFVADTGNHRVQVFHPNGTLAFKFGSEGDADGQFKSPAGIDVKYYPHDLPSNYRMIAVADTGNHRIQVFHPNGTFAFKFGSEGDADGQFKSPDDVLFLGVLRDIAVADTGNNRIQLFYQNGTFLEKFESFALGPAGLDPGPFDRPQSIAFRQEGLGPLFIDVADTGNNRIQRGLFTAGLVSREAHSYGFLGSSGDGPGQFGIPTSVDSGGEGSRMRIIADAGRDRVLVINPFNETERVYSSNGTDGDSLSSPADAAMPKWDRTPGSRYGPSVIADTGNNRVLVFHPNGTLHFTLADGAVYRPPPPPPPPPPPIFDAGLLSPAAVDMWGIADSTVHAPGTVFVADTGNHRVQVFHPNGTLAFKFGSEGDADGQFKSPAGIDVKYYPHDLPSNYRMIAVADTGNHRIQVFHPNGTFAFKFGSEGDADGQFKSPDDVLFLGVLRDIAVADTGNNRIQLFYQNGTFLEKFESFALGPAGLDPGPFDRPQSIAFRQEGLGPLFIDVADTGNNRIQRGLFTAGLVSREAHSYGFLGSSGDGPGQFGIPTSVDSGGEGSRMRIIADAGRDRVLVINPFNETERVYSSNGTDGDSLSSPADAAMPKWDRTPGSRYGPSVIADTGNNRVLVFHPDGTLHFTLGPTAATAPPPDTTRPKIVSVSSPMANGTYGPDRRIVVDVSFDEVVFAAAPAAAPAGVVPTLELAATGGGGGDDGETSAPRHAQYNSGSNSTTLSFAYKVQNRDDTGDLNYTGTAALRLNGWTIKDKAGNDALTDLPSWGSGRTLGERADIRLDGIKPVPVHVFSETTGPLHPKGAEIDVRVRFSENVTVTTEGGTPLVWMATGGAGQPATFRGEGNNTDTLVFVYTVEDGDYTGDLNYTGRAALQEDGGKIRDAAGNDARLILPSWGSGRTLGETADIAIDGVAPTVRSVGFANDTGWYGTGSAIHVLVKFSENVTVTTEGGAAPTVRMETGGDGQPATFGGEGNNTDTLVFVYTVEEGDYADDLNYTGTTALEDVDRAIKDAAGNPADLLLPSWESGGTPAQSRDIVIDTEPPRVLSASAVPPNGISVKFNEGVASGGADASAGWSVSGAGAEGLSVSPYGLIETADAASGVVLEIDVSAAAGGSGGLPDTSPGIRLHYDADQGGIRDRAGNLLQDIDNMLAADRLPPVFVDALITDSTRINVSYTEPSTAMQGAYKDLEIGGDNRPITRHDTAALRSHTLDFSGQTAPSGSNGSLTISQRDVRDGADPQNPLGAGDSRKDVYDGRTLAVISSRITGNDTAVITYTRNAMADKDDYGPLAIDGLSGTQTIASLAVGGGGRIHALTFSPGGVPANATGSVVVNGTAVTAGGDALGSGPITLVLADGQRPSLIGATAVSPNTIRAAFDEPVAAGASDASAAGWSVSGGDAGEGGIAVASVRAVRDGPASDLLEIVLGAALPDTAPDGVDLSYDPDAAAGGGIADPAGNALAASDAGVADGIAPRVQSAAVAGPSLAEIRYTEPVWAGPGAYASVALSSGGDPRPVSGLEGNGTDLHGIAFGGGEAARGVTGVLAMDASAVRDAALLPLSPGGVFYQGLGDGRTSPPPPPAPGTNAASVESAAFTARNTVTITYSDALGPPAGHDGPVYASVLIDGDDAGPARPVQGVAGLETAVHTVEFGGDGVGRGQTGSIALAVDLEGAGSGADRPRLAAGAIPVASGLTVHTVLLPQPQPGRDPPQPVRIEPDGFVLAVDGTAAGESARLAINVSALTAGAAPGAAVFPADPVVLVSSFAEVSFPPGAVAGSIPTDGVIGLYVSTDGPPPDSIDSALGYAGSGPLGLRTIIEAGDDREPIVFDKPVRILLSGQAGGRAFYINGSSAANGGGAITPIDRACAADDLDRTHLQLGGAGECQLDSGGDKIIYTYHLTRFGTAASELGAPPPDGRMCSIRLASDNLEMRAVAGEYSDAVVQGVINSGSEQFEAVEVDADPWYAPGSGTASLPASSTALSLSGGQGSFAPLAADGTAAGIARGLEGGTDAPLWFMLNLTGHAQMQGGQIVQHISYTASCGG